MNEKIRKNILDGIRLCGHSVMCVFDPAGKSPSFAYTIGLTAEFNFELLVVGLDPTSATTIFNQIAYWMRQGNKLEEGEPTDEFTNLPCIFKRCDSRAHEYVIQADNFYGKSVDVLQLVMSDREGRLPGEPKFDHEYMSKMQPLLYSTASH